MCVRACVASGAGGQAWAALPCSSTRHTRSASATAAHTWHRCLTIAAKRRGYKLRCSAAASGRLINLPLTVNLPVCSVWVLVVVVAPVCEKKTADVVHQHPCSQ
eukprot:COSAG01_NODE_1734_length_9366_cov_4.124636_13_plen_104_part_00